MTMTLKSLWSPPSLDPITRKSRTLPIFNLRSQYARNFHLSWIGFFSAFLAWFAFPPLLTLSIRTDLHLTQTQISNSNIIALLATLLTRFIVGPLVDIYGPRLTMASLLIIGAIPSGLAGTTHSAGGLYAVRFFIGILGGTFVPCQAWTSLFFEKNVVGLANALVGGWGNAGGGATYAVMVALYDKLHRHMSQHRAWRVAFVVVPVPVLFFVAVITLLFGTDHPLGDWKSIRQAQNQNRSNTESARVSGTNPTSHSSKRESYALDDTDEKHIPSPESSTAGCCASTGNPLKPHTLLHILLTPSTYIPCLSYMSTFGFELAVDSTLASVLVVPHPELGQLRAGYLASVFGLMNIFTRPLGGAMADWCYRRCVAVKDGGEEGERGGGKLGVKRKRDMFLVLAIIQGLFTIGFGKYIQRSQPDLGKLMGLVVLMSLFNGAANGANFSYVPHCHPNYNGSMSGLVGGFGNLGGIFYTLIFRFQPGIGIAWVISGIFAICVNVVLVMLARVV